MTAACDCVRAEIQVGPGLGWRMRTVGRATIYTKGYIFNGSIVIEGEDVSAHLAERLRSWIDGTADDASLLEQLRALGGHFAFVLELGDRLVACVDRIRSVPLLWAVHDGQILIDDRGPRLSDRAGLGRKIDPDNALAIAMAGYSIGAGTLFAGVRSLRAGEALIVDCTGHRTLRWFIYDAWRAQSMTQPEKRLSEVHRHIIERLATSAAGRVIALPLSAGLDSRMIASGLKECGYRHVHLFSYGRPGNHEANTAKAIAEKLDYSWRFVPFTTAGQRAMFADPDHAKAWADADSGTSVPFEQDWTAIAALRKDGYIPADALVVNGNSGDYISGAHAPASLFDLPASLSAEERRERAVSAVIKKHFRLWETLATPRNDAVLRTLLEHEALEAGATFDETEHPAGHHEFLEYQDRQAKYVVWGERAYEAQGLSWRLPLWDDEIIEFFRRVPLHLKRRQDLYRRVLHDDNWGGVWGNVPVNRKTITPRWIIPVRLLAKAAHLPLGAERWHRFEKRVFYWWMDPLRAMTVVPYTRALLDRRGARHAVSWLAEIYLQQHGFNVDRPF